MNRDGFHAKIAGYDADQLGKILWTLYWRGSVVRVAMVFSP